MDKKEKLTPASCTTCRTTMDEPNPATGLTPSDVKVIRTSWEIVAKDLEETGAVLLLSFFTKYPHNQKYFKAFADVPLDELHDNPRFRAHALNVVTAIGVAVSNLEEPQKIIERFTVLGESHAKRKIDPNAFTELKDAILTTLREACNLDDSGVASWNKLIDVAYGIMATASQSS